MVDAADRDRVTGSVARSAAEQAAAPPFAAVHAYPVGAAVISQPAHRPARRYDPGGEQRRQMLIWRAAQERQHDSAAARAARRARGWPDVTARFNQHRLARDRPLHPGHLQPKCTRHYQLRLPY